MQAEIGLLGVGVARANVPLDIHDGKANYHGTKHCDAELSKTGLATV